jgi:hypothetical protein
MDPRRELMERRAGAGRIGDWPPEIAQDLICRALALGPRTALDEISRWLDYKPPFARWAVRCESATVLAGAVKTELTAYVVPVGRYGVLRYFGNMVGNVSDYSSITFALEVDGAALSGFASIIGPYSPGLNAPRPLMEPLLPGQRVRIVASNGAASSVSNVSGHFQLYHWPVAASVPAEA